jgi:hypothetical protein
MHGTQAFVRQRSSVLQFRHDFLTPQPRSTTPQPVTAPASSASAHVLGVQQPPSGPHTAPGPLHVPHDTAGPHPLFKLPQVAVPQLGGLHDSHVPVALSHLVSPAHVPGQATVPLPQAFATAPHLAPASPKEHSGGTAWQTPPMQSCPAAHLQLRVWPQPSDTVPQSVVIGSGVHVGTMQPLAAASLGVAAVHWLPMQASPPVHPPQSIATPHESNLIVPHLPVQLLG